MSGIYGQDIMKNLWYAKAIDVHPHLPQLTSRIRLKIRY